MNNIKNIHMLTMCHHLLEDSFANIKLIINFFAHVTTCVCTILDCLANRSLWPKTLAARQFHEPKHR